MAKRVVKSVLYGVVCIITALPGPMKKHTTWQDCRQVGYSLSGCYPDDYSVNAILILLPGCPVLDYDSVGVLAWVSPETARLSSFGLGSYLTALSPMLI